MLSFVYVKNISHFPAAVTAQECLLVKYQYYRKYTLSGRIATVCAYPVDACFCAGWSFAIGVGARST
jgi:hypothetical protein